MELRSQPKPTADFTTSHRLTRRELQILFLLAEGNLYTDIAGLLNISSLTVRTHVKNMYLKLGAHNKIEALNKTAWLSPSPISANTYC